MISVQGLIKRHGEVTILRGIDLQINRGEIAVIMGPSGSGKSTFLRCLNGLERFQGGSVEIDGLRIDGGMPVQLMNRLHQRVCRKLGMVFQQFNLFPHKSVLGNVTFAPILLLGMSRDEAEGHAMRLLERVGMTEHAHKRPRQLSGGQQQRVAIARALAMNPEGILFDEPTSALDPRMTGEVIGVMKDLAQDGLTMIVVTHSINLARQLGQTLHVFAQGVVAESGPAQQVLSEPRTEATRSLLTEVRAA